MTVEHAVGVVAFLAGVLAYIALFREEADPAIKPYLAHNGKRYRKLSRACRVNFIMLALDHNPNWYEPEIRKLEKKWGEE